MTHAGRMARFNDTGVSIVCIATRNAFAARVGSKGLGFRCGVSAYDIIVLIFQDQDAAITVHPATVLAAPRIGSRPSRGRVGKDTSARCGFERCIWRRPLEACTLPITTAMMHSMKGAAGRSFPDPVYHRKAVIMGPGQL